MLFLFLFCSFFRCLCFGVGFVSCGWCVWREWMDAYISLLFFFLSFLCSDLLGVPFSFSVFRFFLLIFPLLSNKYNPRTTTTVQQMSTLGSYLLQEMKNNNNKKRDTDKKENTRDIGTRERETRYMWHRQYCTCSSNFDLSLSIRHEK